MAKGPNGERRPADAFQRARMVARIATGEIEEPSDGKNENARALGKKGGAARAKALSGEARSEIAKKGAAKRWRSKPPS